jgi:hypothetical protein
MAELYDTVLQTIKDRCPNLNWKMGGLLRELIIEPINAMQDAVAAYVAEALQNLDITTALANPAKHESTLDAWMSRLRITTPKSTKATGEVTILLDPVSSVVTIPKGTSFSCKGVQLLTSKAHAYTPAQLTTVSEDCWSCTVAVECLTDGCYNIITGSPVTWSSAPAYVQDMYVSAPVTGGSSELTAQEKANLIAAELNSGSISGEQAISTALRKNFRGTVVSAMLGTGNIAKMPLYVKTKQLPAPIVEEFAVLSDLDGKYVAIPAGKAVSVSSVTVDGVNVLFNIVEGSNELKVYLQTDTSASLATVTYVGLPELPKVSAWINSAQRGLPYKFDCKAPVIAYVKVFINTGGTTLDLATKSKLQEYICDKPLNGAVQDAELVSILSSNRYTVTGAILYSVTVSTPTYTNVWSSSGSVSPAGQLNLDGAPVALYTTMADIVSY